VRTFHITDDHLAGLASTGTVTDRGEPGGQPDGSSDTQPAGGPEAVESPSPNVIDLSSRGPERRGGFWSAS
jgi:hypothetical protein